MGKLQQRLKKIFSSQDFNSLPKRLVARARSRKSRELPIDLPSDGFGEDMLQKNV